MILKALVIIIIGKCFFEEVVSEKKATNLKNNNFISMRIIHIM